MSVYLILTIFLSAFTGGVTMVGLAGLVTGGRR